jgi:hypothetical protein
MGYIHELYGLISPLITLNAFMLGRIRGLWVDIGLQAEGRGVAEFQAA